MNVTANKALHRTAIPLRSIAAGELGRYVKHRSIQLKLDPMIGKWMNRPANCLLTSDIVKIVTEPNTDLWQ